jgi:hypothetical protein
MLANHFAMSLEELTQEFAKQVTSTARRFDRPRDLVKFIADEKPTKLVKVTIDMCVMAVDEYDSCWHIDMIEKSEKDDFEQRKEIITKFEDDETRAKFVFCLSLWKTRRKSGDNMTGDDYLPGRAYIIEGVHHLQLFRSVSQGSVQARVLLKKEPEEKVGRSKRKLTNL